MGIFEVVIHDIPKDQAMRDVGQLRAFYTAGWLALMEENKRVYQPATFLLQQLAYANNGGRRNTMENKKKDPL